MSTVSDYSALQARHTCIKLRDLPLYSSSVETGGDGEEMRVSFELVSIDGTPTAPARLSSKKRLLLSADPCGTRRSQTATIAIH